MVTLLIIVIIGSGESISAQSSYDIKAIEKGTPTGYEKELSNGDYVVGQDIDAGLYNVTGIGWADLITLSKPMDLINADKTGVYNNLTLVEGQNISILDQSNTAGNIGVNEVGADQNITFTQIAPETLEAQTIVEEIRIENNEEVCYKNDEEVECSTLKDYDKLEKEVLSLQNNES